MNFYLLDILKSRTLICLKEIIKVNMYGVIESLPLLVVEVHPYILA
jgi:hypothetical protein